MNTPNHPVPSEQEGATKLYDLAVIRTDTSQKKLTGYPMTHAECCVMKSKFSAEEQARIIFVPARPNADPDHGPQGNHEAELIREIAFLKEKLLVAQSAQETIWKANIDLANSARNESTAQQSRIAALEGALGEARNVLGWIRIAKAFEDHDELSHYEALIAKCDAALLPKEAS